MIRGALLRAALGAVAGLLLGPVSVWAAEVDTPAPGWEIYARAVPSNFTAAPVGVPDQYHVLVRNSGSQSSDGSPVTVVDKLPAGVVPTAVNGYDVGFGFLSPTSGNLYKGVALQCTIAAQTASCTDFAGIPSGDTLYIAVTAKVSGSLAEGSQLSDVAAVYGGGAPSASTTITTPLTAKQASFGMESLSAEAVGQNGLSDTQAGDHPYEFTFNYFLNTFDPLVRPGEAEYLRENAEPVEEARDVVVDLPQGFVGDPQVVHKCSEVAADRSVCPPDTQIGVARADLFGANEHPALQEYEGAPSSSGHDFVEPIYNVVPPKGVAAEFMFDVTAPIYLKVTVSHETNYAVRVTVSGIPRAGSVTGVTATFFGDPANDPDFYNRSIGAESQAFLLNPVNCAAGPLTTRASTDSWQHPGSYLPNGSPNLADPNWKSTTTISYPALTGCNLLEFDPSVAFTPDNTRADEPTGMNVDLRVPQASNVFPAFATPELKDATVSLPEGVSISPSAADGLAGCGDAQLAAESSEPGSCPQASVLGTAKIVTPLLEGPLEGQVFLGTPHCDPCTNADAADGNMYRIFLEASGDGVRIKKEGRIYANPSTGQLTTKFEENPALPFSDLELHFKGGLRAPLATPLKCGPVSTTSDLVPWSSPITPDANPISVFSADWDGHGGACPAVLPFSPSFSAGTSNPNAGQFSPLTLTFGREDREQDLGAIQVKTPPGLLGTLRGVPLCGEPQASLGTCSAASQIGSMTVAAGPGSHPFYERGEIYLTGPYKGAPFGLSIVVPTAAGPFNLGNVVVRARIDVDPHTTALTVTSDPFPQVLDGILLRLRTANVTIDRPGFIFNPTSCAQLKIEATVSGAQGAQAQVSVPFAVAGCPGLHFGPSFKVSTSGKTSRLNGASLDAKVIYPTGAQSNIRTVKVDLPKQLPSRLTTLQKACIAAQFAVNPAGCPAASVIGIVRASTPLLPVMLTGPAYFVSHGGEAFPSLEVVLQGYGVRVDLVAATFISRQGITSSTFKSIPDVPVSSFELYLPEGRYSALAANGDLCTQKLLMPTLFTAQDGAVLKQSTKITVTGCPKVKKAAKKKAKKAGNARKSSHGQGRKG
jgi:hypothetical protein